MARAGSNGAMPGTPSGRPPRPTPPRALRRWGDEVGRDPGEIEWGLGLEPEDLDRFLREDVDAYLDMGFSQFTLGFNGPAWRVEDGARWLEWRDARNAGRVEVAAGA